MRYFDEEVCCRCGTWYFLCVVLLGNPATCERFEGHSVLRPQTWELLAVAGLDKGSGKATFRLEVVDASGASREQLSEMLKRVELLFVRDDEWPFSSYGPEGPQSCHTTWTTSKLRARLASLGGDDKGTIWHLSNNGGTLTFSNQARRYMWFAVLTSCLVGSLSDMDSRPVTFKWSWSFQNNGGHLSGDVRETRGVTVLTFVLHAMVALRQAKWGDTLLETALGVSAALAACGATTSLYQINHIRVGDAPQYTLLGFALALDALSRSLLCAVASVMTGSHALAKPLEAANFVDLAWAMSAWLATSVLWEPWRVGLFGPPLYVPTYIERIRYQGEPWNGAALCALSVWLIFSVLLVCRLRESKWKHTIGTTMATWWSISFVLLGSHALRLVGRFLSIHARPLVGGIVGLILAAFTYAVTLRALNQNILLWRQGRCFIHETCCCLLARVRLGRKVFGKVVVATIGFVGFCTLILQFWMLHRSGEMVLSTAPPLSLGQPG